MYDIKYIFRFLLVLLVSSLISLRGIAQIDCDNDTSGYIPIVDLQTGFYLGYQGGLYPGGMNTMPFAHADSGIAIANNLMPINFEGDVDTTYGKMIMLGLGGSSAERCFNKMISEYTDAGFNDSCFRIVNACIENYGLDDMYGSDADDLYYKDVNDFIQAAGLKKKQVQVIWLMTPSLTDSFTTTSAYIDTLTEKYVAVIRKLKGQFSNLKMIYISGLQYGGYTDTLSEYGNALSEPCPYLNDFAIKAVIERQINGDTLLNYSGDDPEAAWIAWGPNVWADGRNLRAFDNLRWMCPTDFDSDKDGFYLSSNGQQKVGDKLYDFFSTDPTSVPWYFGLPYDCFTELDTATQDSVYFPEGAIIWIAQNPVKGVVKFVINLNTNDKANIYVFDMQGNKVVDGVFYKVEPGKIFSVKMITNARGIYILSVGIEGKAYNVPFYLDN